MSQRCRDYRLLQVQFDGHNYAYQWKIQVVFEKFVELIAFFFKILLGGNFPQIFSRLILCGVLRSTAFMKLLLKLRMEIIYLFLEEIYAKIGRSFLEIKFFSQRKTSVINYLHVMRHLFWVLKHLFLLGYICFSSGMFQYWGNFSKGACRTRPLFPASQKFDCCVK